jgi:glycosyltransferase involved in cell wall biosynthesis
VPFLVTPFLHLGDPEDPNDRGRRAYTTPALLSLLQAAQRVFVQTRMERKALEALGIPAARLVLLGMGVDGEECTGGDRERARQAWSIKPGEIAIGHLANQSREKGTVDLLEAAAQLWQQGVRFHLVLAGPEMANFRQYWQSQAPAGPVHRLGVLSDDQKRDFFAGLDVFALPSRSDSFGLVLLEAWANRLPNVAYRAGGVAEVIRDGQDGFLVRCGDVIALADALGRIIGDAGLRRALGTAGWERTRTEFLWADKLETVRAVYESETGGRNQVPASRPEC